MTMQDPMNGSGGVTGLTHIDEKGDARMVDVSNKNETKRIARAEGYVSMRPETLDAIVNDGIAKGDVFACARIAGIMAAKRMPELIPLCHPLMLTKVSVSCEPVPPSAAADPAHPLHGSCGVRIEATCGLTGKTGVEMEALTAASVACLTIYDMCKAIDRGMEIAAVRLLEKDGGKSGRWER